MTSKTNSEPEQDGALRELGEVDEELHKLDAAPLRIRTEVGPGLANKPIPVEETHAGKWEAARREFQPLTIDTPPFRRDGHYVEPHHGVRWEMFSCLIGKRGARFEDVDDDTFLAWRLFEYVVDVPLRGGPGDVAEIRRMYNEHVEGTTRRRAAVLSSVRQALEVFHGADFADSPQTRRHHEALGNDDPIYRSWSAHRATAVWELLNGQYALSRQDDAFEALEPAVVYSELDAGSPAPDGKGEHLRGAGTVAAALSLLVGAFGDSHLHGRPESDTRTRIAGCFRDAARRLAQAKNPLTEMADRFRREGKFVLTRSDGSVLEVPFEQITGDKGGTAEPQSS